MKKLILIPIFLVFIFSCSPDEDTQASTNIVQMTTSEPETGVSFIQFNDIIVKRKNIQSDCEYGGFSLTIRKDINSNKLIDEIIQEINFCNISEDYLTFDNIVSQYSRVPEIVWKNNQLHLQNGLNSSNYKTPIVSYLGPNTNPDYSDDLIDYDNVMAFWYRYEKLDAYYSFKFNLQDREDAKIKMLATVPNYDGWDSDIIFQTDCLNESCFGGANANVTIERNGYNVIRLKTPFCEIDLPSNAGSIQVHEYTHSLHLQWWPETIPPFERPCWLNEGTASFAGF